MSDEREAPLVDQAIQLIGKIDLKYLQSGLSDPNEWPTANATWDDLGNSSKWSCVREGMRRIAELDAELAEVREVVEKYADRDNWGYYDESGCPKGYGINTDACFLGPEAAEAALASRAEGGA